MFVQEVNPSLLLLERLVEQATRPDEGELRTDVDYTRWEVTKSYEDIRQAARETLKRLGAASVNPLIQCLLQSTEPVRRSLAASILGEIGDTRAVGPLIEALKDSNDWVRFRASQALANIGDARAIEPLIQALRDRRTFEGPACVLATFGTAAVEPLIGALENARRPDVREAAAEALGRIGDGRAVRPLIKALKYSDIRVRAHAAEALAKIGDARAIEPLIQALQDGYTFDGVEYTCFEYRSDGTFARTVGPIVVRAANVLAKFGTAAVDPLIQALALRNKHTFDVAAEALGMIGDTRAVEPLIVALMDQDENVRQAAAKALHWLNWQPDRSEIGASYWITKRQWDKCVEIGPPAVEPLIGTLKNAKDRDVREAAAEALGQIGDSRAVGPLTKALNDRWWSVHSAAATALGKIGDARAVEPLIKALREKKRASRSRRYRSTRRDWRQSRRGAAH